MRLEHLHYETSKSVTEIIANMDKGYLSKCQDVDLIKI